MGGKGSGRRRDYASANLVERCDVLSIRASWIQNFLKRCYLEPAPRLRIDFRGFWQVFSFQPCFSHFGGHSWRIVCPTCGKHCIGLYRPWGLIAYSGPTYRCRTCWNLEYAPHHVMKTLAPYLATCAPMEARVMRSIREITRIVTKDPIEVNFGLECDDSVTTGKR